MVETYILVLIASLGVGIILFVRLWALKNAPGALGLILSISGVALWTFGYILEILLPSLSNKILWAKIEYIGIVIIPNCWFLFMLRYTGRLFKLTNWKHLVSWTIPIITLGLTATNEFHHLIWTTIELQPTWEIAPLELSHGGWFFVHTVYSYLLLFSATILLVLYIRHSKKIYIPQSLVMLVGFVLPWFINGAYVLGFRPGPNLDLTPIAFTLTNVMLVIGFGRFHLLNILPVARASIFQAMADGVLVLDNKQRIVEVNPAARHIFEWHDDLLIGQPIQQILPDWNTHTPGSNLTLGSGTARRIYAIQVTPVLNNRQKMDGQVAIFTDITELELAQEQMELQVTALNSASNGIVITDTSGNIEWVNRAFTRLTGYSREEALGQNPRILKSGQHSQEFYRALWDTISAGNVWHGEMVNRRKDGSTYHEEMSITPLMRDDETIEHFIAIKQDITERIFAEAQIKLAHEQALESNRLKTQLLANVSHDLRTPLSAIIGFADMLHSGVFGDINPQQSNASLEMLDSANELLMFVNNLIGQAQLESGKIVLKNRRFSPNELVDAFQSTVSLPASKKELELVREIDPYLPSNLYGDPYWLRQIVLNLTSNAVKFTEHGSITFCLRKVDDGHWCIEVSDTGIGVPEESKAMIFEPFQQVDGSITRAHPGSGLGLSIVKQLVGLMGGSIHLTSTIGVGSTFQIILPLVTELRQQA